MKASFAWVSTTTRQMHCSHWLMVSPGTCCLSFELHATVHNATGAGPSLVGASTHKEARLFGRVLPSIGIDGNEHSKRFHQAVIRHTSTWHDGTDYEDMGIVHRFLSVQPFESKPEVQVAQASYFSYFQGKTQGGDAVVHGLKRRMGDQFVELSELHDACLVLSPHRGCDPVHAASDCTRRQCGGSPDYYVVLDFTSL